MKLLFAAILCVRCAAAPQLHAAMSIPTLLTALLLAPLAAMPAADVLRPLAKPNFLLIFADDHDYGDVSAYHASDVRTPNMDRLGAQGMLFTTMRANATVCSPSRAASHRPTCQTSAALISSTAFLAT